MSYDLRTYDPDSDFDAWYTDTTGGWIRDLLRGDPGALRILEVGCATGRMTGWLVHDHREVVAVTLDPAMLARALDRELPGVVWVKDDVSTWGGWQYGVFDVIVATLLLHEVPDPERLLRVLRGQGDERTRLLVTVPAPDSLHRVVGGPYSKRAAEFGVRRMPHIGAWLSIFDRAGWRVVSESSRILKPYPNDVMRSLPRSILDSLAAYEGPGGTLYYVEAVAK